MKDQEYELLDAIAQDSFVTQAGLSAQLGMAIGSVNWYIKRLINRGYVKVSRLDRTRLKYDLTPKGMSLLTRRAMKYVQDSLAVYKQLRSRAKRVVADLKQRGIAHVFLDGDDEIMDILRLTCIEAGITIDDKPEQVILRKRNQDFQIVVRGSWGS
jgi:DNA-binding MarR family transcriptional regulator